MKRLSLLAVVVIVMALACLSYVASARSAREPKRLFDPLGEERAPAAPPAQAGDASAAVREQEVRINFGAIDFAEARELSFPLFDGRSYTAVRGESEGFAPSARGGFVWRGKIAGPGGWSGDVTLSAEGRALSGLIYSPEAVYEIVPQKDFGHLLVQLDQSLFPACGGALPAPETAAAADAGAAKSAGVSSSAPLDDGSRIDVLVAYTADVRAALGGTTQVEAFAQQAVNVTNTAYINSDINTRLRLAGTLEVGYAETGDLSAALNWARGDATVNAARNSTRADMVALVAERGGNNCGVGYLMTNVGPNFQFSAYSASARGCAVGNLTFAHELGHNQGCHHNPENGGTPVAYPYAFGHYVDGSFRTVMSYSDPCTPPNFCPRVAHFSNPSVSVNGVPTGVADQRDNHRVINNTALTISQFRESVILPAPANDNFADAAPIGGAAGTLAGTNNGATKEQGEPNHAFRTGGSSVWYSWQATADGPATITTAGSNFNTVLAVYTGGGVGALTHVASNDDESPLVVSTSVVTFNAKAGTSYRIAVDGYTGMTGDIALSWSLPQTCAYDISPRSQSFTPVGGVGTFEVNAPAGCGWTASTGDPFINVIDGGSGTGNGTVRYSVAPNGLASPRTGALNVAGQTFVVSQSANEGSTVQLSATSYAVSESAKKVQIVVTRTGDTTTAPASVDFATADGTADSRRDYARALGTINFVQNETSRTVTVFITDDVFEEPPETFTFTLSNISGAALGSAASATVTINSDDAVNGRNPVDAASFNPGFYVGQHYVDFLSREADADGLAFWTGQTTNCGNPNLEVCRVNVSAAFFLSIEFRNTGYLVYRFYKSAYGDATSPGVAGTVPVIRLEEFLPDTQSVARGVVVGQGPWESQLEANKQAFALEFVRRQRFLAAFPASMTAGQFVDKLRQNTGGALTQAERDALVAQLAAAGAASASGRAVVLRAVAEDGDLQSAERNRAFVLMQYFGYLRRNPDDAPEPTLNFAGWKFWLDKLDAFGGNAVAAEMVKAFITSDEYRRRFGP